MRAFIARPAGAGQALGIAPVGDLPGKMADEAEAGFPVQGRLRVLGLKHGNLMVVEQLVHVYLGLALSARRGWGGLSGGSFVPPSPGTSSALLAAGLFLLDILNLRIALCLQVYRKALAIGRALHVVAIALVLLRFLGLLLQVGPAEGQGIAAAFRGDRAGAVAIVVVLDLAEMGHCHFLEREADDKNLPHCG